MGGKKTGKREGRKEEREEGREGEKEGERERNLEAPSPTRRHLIILLKEFHQQRTKHSNIGTYGALLIQTTTMYVPKHINANCSVYIMLFICMFSVLAIRIG